jgi:hypothetical protein
MKNLLPVPKNSTFGTSNIKNIPHTMKKTLLLVGLASFISVITQAQKSGAADDPKSPDEIINKYIDAMGGKDKLASTKSVYEEDSLNQGGFKIPVKVWIMNKKAMRVEFTFNGMTGYQVIRTDSGWGYNPLAGQTVAEPMTTNEVKSSKTELDIETSLVNYKEKGYKASYEGKDQTEGSESYKIKITITDSLSETYYIDPDTYLVIQVKTKGTINGKTQEQTTTLTDYKKTPDGYMVPMESNASNMGDLKVYSVKINSPIDDKIFSPRVKVAGK